MPGSYREFLNKQRLDFFVGGIQAVGVSEVREGVFVHCCHFMTATAGSGYAPSVWSAAPHETAKQARMAGIAELLEGMLE